MTERDEILLVARDAELEGRVADAAALRIGLGRLSTIEELLGKTMTSVERHTERHGNDYINFEATTGERWKMYYEPDCCAVCTIEDITGDLQDLVGSPIAMAEESTNSDESRGMTQPYVDDSFTWTFYKFATAKGYVTIRWYGSSNGYYSETASFVRLVT